MAIKDDDWSNIGMTRPLGTQDVVFTWVANALSYFSIASKNNNSSTTYHDTLNYEYEVGQQFTLASDVTIRNIQIRLQHRTSSNYNIRLNIYDLSAGLPNTLLQSSSNVVSSNSEGAVQFNFNLLLVAGQYAFTTSYEDIVTFGQVEKCVVATSSGNTYSGGVMMTKYTGGSWTLDGLGYDLCAKIFYE